MKTPPVFEIQRDLVEITWGGFFGGPPDTGRVMAPGIEHYLVDGVEVSKEEYVRRAEEWLRENQYPPAR